MQLKLFIFNSPKTEIKSTYLVVIFYNEDVEKKKKNDFRLFIFHGRNKTNNKQNK